MNMETLIALMLCVDPMWHQSRHLSSATRRCVPRCITFVMALLVAPPTQMESKTCTCCKHESTYWKSLTPLFSPMYNLSMQPCHPARYNPSRCAFCKVSAALRCYISKAMYKSLACTCPAMHRCGPGPTHGQCDANHATRPLWHCCNSSTRSRRYASRTT